MLTRASAPRGAPTVRSRCPAENRLRRTVRNSSAAADATDWRGDSRRWVRRRARRGVRDRERARRPARVGSATGTSAPRRRAPVCHASRRRTPPTNSEWGLAENERTRAQILFQTRVKFRLDGSIDSTRADRGLVDQSRWRGFPARVLTGKTRGRGDLIPVKRRDLIGSISALFFVENPLRTKTLR